MLRCAVLCYAVLSSAVLCCAVLCCTVLCFAYMHTYILTCTHMHTCIHAYMHICIPAYMHTCIHVPAYMHICMHTHMHISYFIQTTKALEHCYLQYLHAEVRQMPVGGGTCTYKRVQVLQIAVLQRSRTPKSCLYQCSSPTVHACIPDMSSNIRRLWSTAICSTCTPKWAGAQLFAVLAHTTACKYCK